MSDQDSSLDPSCWGPAAWFTLHSFAMGYPENNPPPETMGLYKQFYENIQYTLPCVWCKVNFVKNISELPINDYLGSRRDLAYWVYLLHNKVNDETGVDIADRPSFDDVYAKYDSFRGDCDNDTLTCGGREKKCNMVIKNSLKDADLSSNVYNCYWPLIIIITALLIIIAVISLKK